MSRTPREALAARHAPLVASIARRFLGRGAEYDDLFQLGMIGLLKAIEKAIERETERRLREKE